MRVKLLKFEQTAMITWVPRFALLRCVHEKGGALISDLRPGY
jgi:hypothetical protein